jgi:hypothetical protein
MKTPLIKITIPSIYKNKNHEPLPLPPHMAKCTPDTHAAINNIAALLEKKGGHLILSDMFRSYEMQSRSHNDYTTRRKKAFSPPPGGSFHEAGRGFDLDLQAMKIPLKEFWKIAAAFGVTPVIKHPNKKLSEAWHFDCRGSHQLLYDYYARKAGNNLTPYAAAAASAILSIGIHVNLFYNRQLSAALQSCLIRLGMDIGNMDGQLGRKTKQGLGQVSINFDASNIVGMLGEAEALIKRRFPGEY